MILITDHEAKPNDYKESFSLWLDCFRWIAALLVVFTHVNNRLLVKVLSLPHDQRTAAHYAFAILSGFGHQAVVAFFVLSGMLVGGGSLASFRRTGKINIRGYLLKRLTRLWLVLIPSFAATLALDTVGISLFPGSGASPYNPAPEHGVSSLICNAFFLQTALCNQYGTNGALWSLFHEFWYYIAWLLVLVGCMLTASVTRRLAFFLFPLAILVALSTFQFVGPNVAAYSIIWLLGVLASARQRPLLPIGVLPMAIVVVCYLLLVRVLIPTDWADATFGVWFVCDTVLAILLANLILCMKGAKSELIRPPGGEIHRYLAGFAFSLYCTHSPVLNFYVALMMFEYGIGWQMVPHHAHQWLVVLGGMITAVAFGYVFSLVTESRTDRLRQSVDNALQQALFAVRGLYCAAARGSLGADRRKEKGKTAAW